MIARGCTESDLREALRRINETNDYNERYGPSGNFQGNIAFRRLEPQGRGFLFTLRVLDSKAPGHRINAMTGRHIASACWHAHGRFFSALFDVAPRARVFSSFYKRDNGEFSGWITREHGNWTDGNIGSVMYPVRMSESCEC